MTRSESGAVLAYALPTFAANRKQHSSTSASIDSVVGESIISHDQHLLGLRGELDAPFDGVLNGVKKLGMADADPKLTRAHSSDSFFLPGDDRVESLRGAASSHAALVPSHDKSGKTARDKGKSVAKDESGTGSSTLVPGIGRVFGNDAGASSSGSAKPATLIKSGKDTMRGWSPLDLRQSNHDASSTASSSRLTMIRPGRTTFLLLKPSHARTPSKTTSTRLLSISELIITLASQRHWRRASRSIRSALGKHAVWQTLRLRRQKNNVNYR